ncbi:MAG TPA: 16S rRNA (uracil(1498)-N(3))-methyltransferase [Desulfobulbaceae bacterium]|nr:16S rRNA (uracil(1498)-N(3))-methyltransferase [Desulfobulbaceae bacterium]
MNIILVEEAEIAGGRLTLTDRRAEHIVKILRSEPGDRVRIGVIGGRRGFGTIDGMKKKYPFAVELQVDLTEPPGKLPPLDLILALPRPIMLKRILSQVTALGVGTIHLINANRVEKSFWEAGLLEPEEYRTHLLQGLEQAVDTRLPEVRLHPKFKPFIEDYWPTVAGGYRHLLLADPSGPSRLSEVVTDNSGRLALAVGPEGGWVDYELEKFRVQGFCCCTIGERILKVDTAVIALHAAISTLRQAAAYR